MLGMHGTYEANHAMHDCDLMIAVGARFDDRITGRLDAFSPGSKKIHVDIDPSSINKNVKVDLGIVGDCGHVLEDMVRLWRSGGTKSDKARARGMVERRSTTGARASRSALSELEAGHQAAIRGAAPLRTDEGSQHLHHHGSRPAPDVGGAVLHFEEPNRWMTSGGLGTMGYGLPAAIGVQMAHPDALVIDIAGEASILMNMQEMSTAAQYRLPVKIFILNNEYMGMVRQWQELLHGGRYSESYSEALPDFVKLAEAYRRQGHPLRRSRQARCRDQEMIDYPGPVIFDCLVAKEENCFPMIPSGKAHNEMILLDLSDDAGLEIGSIIDEKGKMLV